MHDGGGGKDKLKIGICDVIFFKVVKGCMKSNIILKFPNS